MSEVLKRFYFALFDDGLTLKTLNLAYIGFCIQTLHLMMILFYFQENMDISKIQQCHQLGAKMQGTQSLHAKYQRYLPSIHVNNGKVGYPIKLQASHILLELSLLILRPFLKLFFSNQLYFHLVMISMHQLTCLLPSWIQTII